MAFAQLHNSPELRGHEQGGCAIIGLGKVVKDGGALAEQCAGD
jgi:hypothetical protein